MADVLVSALRIRSMLRNRRCVASDLATSLVLSVDSERLVSEDIAVQFDDLLKLASFFKRPWSYLLIDGEETFTSRGVDNRTRRNQLRPPSSELLDELETVTEMLKTASELFPDLQFEVPTDRIKVGTPEDGAGLKIRDFLNISDELQLHSSSDFGALRLWGDALQARGVFVSQRKLADPTIRAFSRIDGGQAVVVLDTEDTAYARIFSMLHEYNHIILRSTGLCDLDDHSAVERYCNSLAASTMMPADLVKAVLAGRSFGGDDEVADDLLRQCSQVMRVSQAALLIRLRDLKLITSSSFDRMETRRAARRADGTKTTGGTYYPPRINRVGRRYAHRVFESLDDGVINRQDASSLLEIGEHLVSSYRQALEAPTGVPGR